MQSITTAFSNAAKAQSRTIIDSIGYSYPGGTGSILEKNIISLEWHQAMNTEELAIGEAHSSYIIATLRPETNHVLSATQLRPAAGFEYGTSTQTMLDLGTFYVTSVESHDNYKTLTITAYDKLGLLEQDYIPSNSITFPTTAQTILNDICSQNGITNDVTMPSVTINEIRKGSVNQQIAWLAGLCGKNAYMTYNNHLNFRWYTSSGQTISRDIQYLSGFVRTTASDFTVHSLLTGTDENPISCGSGVGIVHTNPYMTQDRANTIFNTINEFTYTPCEVKWRGNPAMEVGDTVLVTDENGTNHTVCIMEQTMLLTGGMSATINCYGMTENEIVMHVSPTEKRLKAEYTGLISKLQEATKTIIGENGGYYELLFDNNTGLPRGWSIRNTATVTSTTKMWLFTNGGLGYSADGGQTISNIALTADGKIVANSITTGLLQVLNTHGDTVFSANMDTGEVIINGSAGNVQFTNCPFTTIYEIDHYLSDYSNADLGVMAEIITQHGGVGTAEQMQKYDMDLNGKINGIDLIRIRDWIQAGTPDNYKSEAIVNMPASGTDNLIDVYVRSNGGIDNHVLRVGTTGVFADNFSYNIIPAWTQPTPYSSRCAVASGGYAQMGKKVEVSLEISIPSNVGTDTSTYFWMLTGFPTPSRDAALSISKTNDTEGAGVYSACISDEGSTYRGVLVIRYNGKALVGGDKLAITGSYWAE